MSTETRVGRIVFPVSNPYLYNALAECGDYCVGEMILYNRFIKPGDTIVDAGAFIGILTLLFSELVRSSGKVLAFEPSAFSYDLLRHNLAQHGRSNVITRRCALSDHRGTAEFFDPDPNAAEGLNLGSLSLDSRIPAAYGRYVPTEILPLDDLALEQCAFIKIDVEGTEAAVVRGARRTIERHRPFISLEVGDPAADADWLPFLLSLGYRVFVTTFFIVSAPNFKKRPIDSFPSVVCANAIAVPPGADEEKIFKRIFRREVRSIDDLQAINRRFVKDSVKQPQK